MDGATVSVAVVTSRTEAELIVGMLRSHGLRAASAADGAVGQEAQLQLQDVRVVVAPSDERRPTDCWPPPVPPAVVGPGPREALS
jgi:hypothetical protein